MPEHLRRAGGCSLQQESPQAFAAVIGLRVKELILYSQQRTEHIILGVFLNVKIKTSMKKADLCNLEASDLTCRKRCRNVGHGYRLQNDTGHREM